MANFTRLSQAACIVALLAACTSSLLANGEKALFECPCTLEFDGEESVELSVGLRNFSNVDLKALKVEVALQIERSLWGYKAVMSTIEIDVTVPSGGDVVEGTFTKSTMHGNLPKGEYYVLLRLLDDGGTWHDSIFMRERVDPSAEFTVNFLDYLIDSDEDGVGDLNEILEGTDFEDASSVPADSVVDVVALYGKNFAKEYDGDATTRIQHLFELANQILDDSDVAMQWRVVGTVEVEMDDQTTRLEDINDLVTEGERHGSDLAVLFGPWPEKGGYCGFAGVYGWGRRGELSVDLTYALATVVGSCGATTLAHELGHLMGLHHSVWQNSTGAWRWSRGHGVENDFSTVMSYGRGGVSEDVFSDPDTDCGPNESPCGIAHDEDSAADSVASLNAVRFQYARARDSFPDSDGDGFVDPVDDLPDDATEWLDTDGDGEGNNADTDDDGDGVLDVDDAFPLDPTEIADTDEDGVGDVADAFPEDPNEWEDSDGDGVGDNSDVFPTDPSEWDDTDGDGVGDNGDAFPEDATEWADTDSDGQGDNADTDDDGDSTPDIDDAYPLDENLSRFFSYKFVLESSADQVSSAVKFQSFRDEPGSYLLIGVPSMPRNGVNAGGAYVISLAELEELDALDGSTDHIIGLASIADSQNSWKLVGTTDEAKAGDSVSVGDIDGDDNPDLVVGAPDARGRAGSLYVIPFENLSDIDSDQDRIIELNMSGIGDFGWRLDGREVDGVGFHHGVAVGDVDADGFDDILVGTYQADIVSTGGGRLRKSAYFIPSARLEEMDQADGENDRVVDIFGSVGPDNVKFFLSEHGLLTKRTNVDLSTESEGDNLPSLLISGVRLGGDARGSVYWLSVAQLSEADNADGEEDGQVDLAHIANQKDSWQFHGAPDSQIAEFASFVEDFSNDGKHDLSLSRTWSFLLLASQDFESFDAADDSVDGKIEIPPALNTGNSLWVRGVFPFGQLASNKQGVTFPSSTAYPPVGVYHVTAPNVRDLASRAQNGSLWFDSRYSSSVQHLRGSRPLMWLGSDMQYTVTLDGDELEELLITASGDERDVDTTSVVYLISSRDLAELARRASEAHGPLLIEDMWGDQDEDGLKNFADLDDDDDYIDDIVDVFHLDSSEWADSDSDGFGDNFDAFPFDWSEYLDTDEDGLGDRYADNDDDNDGILDWEDEFPLDTDNDGLDNAIDEDDDGDGVLDQDDAFPYDPTEASDWDSDGIGDNADSDDDNDGVGDDLDAFPFDPTETADSDEDGVGDNADAFPNDPDEWVDTDGDGTGNNEDTDDDGDGVPDVDDKFPLDPTLSVDSDDDGVADEYDAFPNNPDEWSDLDGDGTGDNTDPDIDGDGVVNLDDEFPTDNTRVDLRSVVFIPWNVGSDIGAQAGSSGDTDGDGWHDILLSGETTEETYEVYLVSSAQLVSADMTDGQRDGQVNIGYVADLANSWKINVPDEDDEGVIQLLRVGQLTSEQTESFLISTSAGLYSDAYVLAPSDLEAADGQDENSDGIVELSNLYAQDNSWRFSGDWNQGFGHSATYVVSIDDDALPDICIGAPGAGAGDLSGSVFVASAASLLALDELHASEADGIVSMTYVTRNYKSLDEEDRVWKFEGENANDQVGSATASGDFDGDGLSDIVIGAPTHDSDTNNDGAVYLVGSLDWDNTDEEDDSADRHIDLGRIASQPHSWKFAGDGTNKNLGSSVVVADLNQDSTLELIVVQQETIDVISAGDFAKMDQADGSEDGVVSVQNYEAGEDSWRMKCPANWGTCSIAVADGPPSAVGQSVVIGINNYPSGDSTIAYLISRDDFESLDELDGTMDRVMSLSDAHRLPNSYRFVLPKFITLALGTNLADAGDVDGDGQSDLLVAVRDLSWNSTVPSEAYVISSAELEYLDGMDGRTDGSISLQSVTSRTRSPHQPSTE